jgi:arginine decarboxylase
VVFGKVPQSFFLARGSAEGYTPLNAFDGALINAGIGDLNLVKVSSVIPPGCSEIQPRELPRGAIVPVAYAFITSDIPGEIISAAVAVALPEEEQKAGLIMEYSARGHQEEAEEIVRTMAVEGMNIRGRGIRVIKSLSVEYKVQTIGAAIAAVVLLPISER